MILRYNSLSKVPREVKVNLKKVMVIAWRYSYNSVYEKTHLYVVYLCENGYRTSIHVPFYLLLDKEATFEYLTANFKDKCLEK